MQMTNTSNDDLVVKFVDLNTMTGASNFIQDDKENNHAHSNL